MPYSCGQCKEIVSPTTSFSKPLLPLLSKPKAFKTTKNPLGTSLQIKRLVIRDCQPYCFENGASDSWLSNDIYE